MCPLTPSRPSPQDDFAERLRLLAGVVAAAGFSAYLVRWFAWPETQRMKIMVAVTGLAGFIPLVVLSLLPVAYVAGVSFALLGRMGWPMLAGFYVAALATAVITALLTLLLVLAVSRIGKLFIRHPIAPVE